MVGRRNFIKALAALPALLYLPKAKAKYFNHCYLPPIEIPTGTRVRLFLTRYEMRGKGFR